MRKVIHPICCGCGRTNPEYISDRYNIRVCYTCLYEVATWLMNRDLVDGNPIAEELFDGVWQGGTIPGVDEYTVVHRSKYDGMASSYSLAKRATRKINIK